MEVNMSDVLAHHKKQYVIETEIGQLILRPLRKTETLSIEAEIMKIDQTYETKLLRLALLNERGNYPAGLTPEEVSERMELVQYIAEWTDYYVIRCFVSPVLKTPDELMALSEALSAEEWGRVQLLFPVLTSLGPINKVNTMVLSVCKEYNIPLADDLTAQNMTALQERGLIEDMNERTAKTEKYLKEMMPE